eukprot:6209107-Pleurochrysis_carterae.AAC.3
MRNCRAPRFVGSGMRDARLSARLQSVLAESRTAFDVCATMGSASRSTVSKHTRCHHWAHTDSSAA